MFEPVLRLVVFGLIVSAPSWRRLAWQTALAVLLIGLAFGWVTGWRFSLVVPGGDANIGAGIVLFYGISWLAAGLVSRAISLAVRSLGHRRPWSLWIEATGFFGVPVAVEQVMVGA